MLPTLQNLNAIYAQINAQHFQNVLPDCEIKWSRQLTRAAGNIDVKNRVIKLSVPLLVDSYAQNGASFEICGVVCENQNRALEEILKHEMIHLWLFERKMPWGHTREFRLQARLLGQPKTRHQIARPAPTSGWIYLCGHCQSQIARRRRFGRAVACAKCCKTYNRGVFDARFQLRGHKVRVEAPIAAVSGSSRRAPR